MAKKARKRKAWTAEQVRTVENNGSPKETRIAYRQEAEAYRRRDPAKGI